MSHITVDGLGRLSHIHGHLWMGGRPDSYDGYSLVVSCEQHLARKPAHGWDGTLVHLPMVDDEGFEIPTDRIRLVGELVAFWGEKTLVHCTAGLNRSGLVVHEALCMMLECSVGDALAVMRAARDELVLCNRVFERHVLRQRLPTAETSMFALDP